MKKNKLLLISAAALVVAASAYFLFFNDKSVEVSTMNTYKTNIIKTIEVSGIINSKDIEVISLEPGKKVVKAYVEENDIVKKNQLLSELDADDLNISKYLHGETLIGNNQKGYGLILVDGYPLAFYKESNNQVKNLFPKGLRRWEDMR